MERFEYIGKHNLFHPRTSSILGSRWQGRCPSSSSSIHTRNIPNCCIAIRLACVTAVTVTVTVTATATSHHHRNQGRHHPYRSVRRGEGKDDVKNPPNPVEDTTDSGDATKKYKCDLCPRSFDRPSALAQHDNVHTAKKPHVCLHCNRVFSVKSNVTRHLDTCPVYNASPSGSGQRGAITNAHEADGSQEGVTQVPKLLYFHRRDSCWY
ncbi:hypothetical protein BS47DRAFT_544088 [Hydnum rufescens UP504]|uniref:C2H2-type domain-containing protein n=1 Tax=Hydnum rufescens UP504 TaxID=1448309 RepID=A0A9P6E0L5_9AGAM|nr:hypothetical protein BS47DRAFT_544088 [Hydnum rufescens UP504]